MILVDTSVWIDHLRHGDAQLVVLLEAEQVTTHPYIIGELACGNLKNRTEVLVLLHELPRAPSATDGEALTFIEQHRLMGRGIGYLDVHLLAAAALTDAQLWTRDRRLAAAAADLNLAFQDAS